MQAGGIDSQDLANRLLDAGVNMGIGTGAMLFQQAINAVGQEIEPRPPFATSLQDWPIKVDRLMGPATIAAANKYPADKLLDAFRAARCAYYEQIVAANPGDARYLAGWTARAMK